MKISTYLYDADGSEEEIDLEENILGSVDICFSALEAHRKLACGKTAVKCQTRFPRR